MIYNFFCNKKCYNYHIKEILLVTTKSVKILTLCPTIKHQQIKLKFNKKNSCKL